MLKYHKNNFIIKFQVTIRLIFPELSTGYWSMGPIEISYGNKEYVLSPPNMTAFLGAPRGYSFTCAEPLVFSNDIVSLTFFEIQVRKISHLKFFPKCSNNMYLFFQVQPMLNGAAQFGTPYNCVGFTTVPIW